MINIDQTVFRWILKTTASSKSQYKRNTLKKFLLFKSRSKHYREELVRQVVNAISLSKSVQIHLVRYNVKWICKNDYVILAESDERRLTAISDIKQTLQNISIAANKVSSAFTSVSSSTCRQTNFCALRDLVKESFKDIKHISISQAFASSIKFSISNDVARVKLFVLEFRTRSIQVLMNISIFKITCARLENASNFHLTSNIDVRAFNSKKKEDAKKLYSNLDSDIDRVSFHIVTRYFSTMNFSSSEMLIIYSFCCHDSVNNIVKLRNRVSSLIEQQWLLEDMKVNLKQSDEIIVQLHKDVKTASTFSIDILEHATRQFLSQFALLSTIVQQVFSTVSKRHSISFNQSLSEDRRLFVNCNVSWSVFICEVQNSEKSHTLSCLIGWRNYRWLFSLSYLTDEWIKESSNIKFISRYMLRPRSEYGYVTSSHRIASFRSSKACSIISAKSSINRTHRFSDHAQILSERITKWAKDLSTKVLLNDSRRVSSRDIRLTTWERLKYESSSTSKLFIS